MKKTILIIIALALVIVAGFYVFNGSIYKEKEGVKVEPSELENLNWTWVKTELRDGKQVLAPNGKFVLLLKEGDVTSSTDCNKMSGKYVSDDGFLSFSPFAATKMYCEGSLESQYSGQLGLTNSYTISGDELKLILNRDVGVMVFKRGGSMVNEPVKETPKETSSIKLYYYNPALDQGPGGVQCTSKGLVEVKRTIPKTTTPLQDSIKLLLKGELTSAEKAGGLTTEFPLIGVNLVSGNIKDGTATLKFEDPQNKTSGGSCRISILKAQIEKTAKQFSSVKQVIFVPEEVFQP